MPIAYPVFLKQRAYGRLANVLRPALKMRLLKAPSPRYVRRVIDDADDEGDDFADELSEYGDELPDARLEQAARTGSTFLIDQAVNVVAVGALAYAFWQPKLQEQAAERARVYAEDEWPKDLPPFGGGAPAGVGPRRGELEIRFNQMDARAGEWANRHAAQLVSHVTDSEKDRIATIIGRANTEGLTVQQVARDLRFVGLLPQHQTAVARYQRELAAEGRPMDQVFRMADKYARSLLKFRTRMIARQELLTATHQGQLNAVLDAIQHGEIDPSRTMRHWHTADDELVCPICAPMDNEETPANAPWILGDGTPVMIPQEAHIQCRCSWSLVTQGDARDSEEEGS